MGTNPLDYRQFYEKGKTPPPGTPDYVEPRWWTLKGDEAAKSVTSTLQLLKESQKPRAMSYVAGTRLYGNVSALATTGYFMGVSTSTVGTPGSREKITYNVVQSATDTVTSKMAKNKPRPFFLSSGGNYRAHRKARRLNKFVDGVFYENKVYQLGPIIFRDGAVWGDGTVKVVDKHGRVAFERVLPTEIFVDEVEALVGQPRQMHHVRPCDRRKLAEMYPEYAKQIAAVDAVQIDPGSQRANVSDMVLVRESWHLPSGPDADDGKHLLTIEDYAISDMEPWEHDFFPFARFRWCPRLVGYWSQSLAEQLQPTQFELNRLKQSVQRAQYMASKSVTWIPKGSNVPKEFINNADAVVIEYTGGRPPHREVYPIVPPEIYQEIEQLKREAFELAGISLLSATSQKPAGLDSKVALREFSDIESDRFRTIGQEYENFFIDLAKIALAMARDIAKKHGGKYVVKARGRGSMEQVEWSDIALEEDDYGLECFPVSSLPRDPAGRLQTITEYAQAGYLTPREARRLLDFPDLESVESLANAAEDWLVQCLDKIVDEGKFTSPQPYNDLKLGRELALQYYNVGQAKGLEEDRLEMLRRWLMQIDAIEKKAAMAAAAQTPPQLSVLPGGMPGAPTAPPMPVPPSQLVPQAPPAMPRAA